MSHRKFSELEKKMSLASRRRSNEKTKQLMQEKTLKELRELVGLTQKDVAKELSIEQSSVSKMEGWHDMRVSTLIRYAQALGGEMEFVAVFPDRRIVINQFRNMD